MYGYYVIYFLVGILQDLLWTFNVKYVATDRPVLAATYSFLTSVVSLTVFYNILTKLDEERSIVAIIIYSVGIGVGTLLGMKSKFGKSK